MKNITVLIIAVFSLFYTFNGHAANEVSIWSNVKEKLKVGVFTEFMSPSLDNRNGSILFPDSTEWNPTNAFSIFWATYDIGEELKLVYFQRLLSFFTTNDYLNPGSSSQLGQQGMSIVPLNPRFAIRRTNLFKISGLKNAYDLYVQPGVTPGAINIGNTVELGFRTSQFYSIPQSSWTIGGMSEFTVLFYNKSGAGNDISAWAMPMASYNINKTFATQHWVTVPFRHERDTSLFNFEWGNPKMPFIQNGISANVTEWLWTSVFINNYLLIAPTLRTTWFSLWVTASIL